MFNSQEYNLLLPHGKKEPGMPHYIIRQYITCTRDITIHSADSATDAVARAIAGQGEIVPDTVEFIEVDMTLGIPSIHVPELASGLQDRGIRCTMLIPSVEKVSEIPEEL